MCTVLTDKDVRVRKVHRCWWCDEAIEAGEAAHYQVWVDGGDFSSCYLHPECNRAVASVYHEDPWALEYIQPGTRVRGEVWEKGDEGP